MPAGSQPTVTQPHTYSHPTAGLGANWNIPIATREALPLFDSAPGSFAGLDLLALAAAANATQTAPTPAPNPLGAADLAQLHAPGPYNPGTAVSTAIAQKILSLKFVEMGDITSDDVYPGRPATSRPPISDILVWVEKFSTMAAILAKRFPEKAAELFAYQACIVRCERHYRSGQWACYDRAFRREALASKDLNWSVINNRLYQEAFTGRARDIPRCTLCFEDDHMAQTCPKNPTPAYPGLYLPPPHWSGAPSQPHGAPSPHAPRSNRGPSQELCIRFNRGLCRQTTCERQ